MGDCGGEQTMCILRRGGQALEIIFALVFAFVVIPMLRLPSHVEKLLERLALVLVETLVGFNIFRTPGSIEARKLYYVKLKYGDEERQIRAAEMLYHGSDASVFVVLATAGATFMFLDQVGAFSVSRL